MSPTPSSPAPLYIFARFNAHEGSESELAALLAEHVAAVRAESGCLGIAVYRSTRNPRLFYLHSTWETVAAFDAHAERPNTEHFVATVEGLITHPLDITRTERLDETGVAPCEATSEETAA